MRFFSYCVLFVFFHNGFLKEGGWSEIERNKTKSRIIYTDIKLTSFV